MQKRIALFSVWLSIVLFGSASWAISWEDNLTQALEKAKSEGTPVMADFYTDWCGWCKKLDTDVYEDTAVNRLAEKFICVKVNCEIDKEAFTKYGLRGYPTIIFFGPAGTAIETVVGYRNAQAFAETMTKVLEKMPTADAGRPRPPDQPVARRERAAGEFTLSGIMGSKAIINDTIVAAGDEVGDARVMAITRDSVRVRYQDEDLILKIE